MQQERMKILEMLAAKKINAEEAHTLIAALQGDGRRATGDSVFKDGSDRRSGRIPVAGGGWIHA